MNRFVFLSLFFAIIGVQLSLVKSSSSQSTYDSTAAFTKNVLIKLKRVEELRISDTKQAILFAKEAISIAEQLQNQELIADCKLALGKCYAFLDGSVEAIEQLNNALEIYGTLDNKIKKAQTFKQIGDVYYYSYIYTTALDYYNNVYKCGLQIKDTLLIIESLIGRGSVYGNTNRMDSALLTFKESFILAKKVGNTANEVQSLFYLGDVNLYSGKPSEALKVYNQVESNYNLQKVNPKIIPSLYNSITRAYLSNNDLISAKLYNKKTKEALNEVSRLQYKMDHYFLKYQIDTLEKNYKSALRSFEEFKIYSDSINNSSYKEKIDNIETLHELEKKQREIESLTNENTLKDISIRQKRLINYGSMALVVFFILITFQAIRSAKKIREKNLLLQEQQEELTAANEELITTNEELYSQRSELENVLDHLKDTQNQLIQSEKMASLGVLAAGIAHEINNPLNFIRGGITGIEEHLKENLKSKESDLRPLVEGIHLGVDRAAAIVTSLNQYSRHDDSPQINSNLHSIIDNCLTILHNQIKNRIEVVKNYSANPAYLKCNESKLHQVFLNILANSAQAIENKGNITINTKSDQDKIFVKISDTGIGISKENLPKIFDPFFTTKEPGKGTGLGLSITYKILQEHNASIRFESEPNKGTDVTIIFAIK